LHPSDACPAMSITSPARRDARSLPQRPDQPRHAARRGGITLVVVRRRQRTPVPAVLVCAFDIPG
jgi:hypothetical protein